MLTFLQSNLKKYLKWPRVLKDPKSQEQAMTVIYCQKTKVDLSTKKFTLALTLKVGNQLVNDNMTTSNKKKMRHTSKYK